MTHYTDIGFFDINSVADVDALYNKIHKTQQAMIWDVISDVDKTKHLYMFKIGEIRFFAKLDVEKGFICSLSLAHNNENITKMDIVNIFPPAEDCADFPTLVLEKDGIPFWFECPNVEIFNMDEKDCDVKIASFAQMAKIRDKNETETEFSDELYHPSSNDPTVAIMSGEIKSIKKETNLITGNNYYALDIDCLDVHIKVLLDVNAVEESELQVGKIIYGEFWNTAILVADNHPDYF